jgi:hypothetical protein
MQKSTWVISCIAVASTATAIWLWLQRPEDSPATAGPVDPALALECQDAAAPPDAAQPADAPLAAAPVGAKELITSGPPPDFGSSMESRLLKKPEYRKAMWNQQRVMYEEAFHDLQKALGLTAAQADRLLDLLAEQRVRMFESQYAQWQRPIEERTGGKAPMQEMRARNDAEVAELLGPSTAIRLAEYRATQEARAEVNSVRNELARGSEPLRQDQFDPLVAVANVEIQRLNQEIGEQLGLRPPDPDPEGDARRIELTVAANQRILDAARPLLTGAQLAGLQDLYRRQRLQMESENALNRMRFAAASGDSTAATPK